MDDDELQNDQSNDDGANDGGDSGSDNSAPPSGDQAGSKEDKRVNDLMGKWQSEEARANRLEAELNALKGKPAQGDESQNDGGSRVSEFEEFARENARNLVFASDPKLAAAGLTVEDITGSTLEEMKASAIKHLKIVGGIESRMRSQILTEHGLDPEVSTGAGTEQAPSFSGMSDKEFADFLAARDARPR